ncbi:MAG: hypothetical protein M1411_02180 [Candidatus Thermoplasmatota archaeon]|nr:hypothetical protein [Candidatus Thermoplasmatota archaeon]
MIYDVSIPMGLDSLDNFSGHRYAEDSKTDDRRNRNKNVSYDSLISSNIIRSLTWYLFLNKDDPIKAMHKSYESINRYVNNER